MKILVKYEKIVPTISEIDLDEEKVVEDFGSVQNFIDFVKIRQSFSNEYLVKGTKEDLYKNLEKYKDTDFNEINYIKENGKKIKTVNGFNEDKLIDLSINNFEKKVDEYQKKLDEIKISTDKKKTEQTTEQIEKELVNDNIFRVNNINFD